MTTGLDLLAVSKALSPLIAQLTKGLSSTAAVSFKKWEATNFSKRLAKKLVAADKVKTIWAPDKETSLLSIYYPSKIKMDNIKKRIDAIPDLPDGNLVIEGIVGHGKSMFLRYLFLQELAGKGCGALPIFIELRTLTDKRDLGAHIRDALQRMEISLTDEVYDHLLKSGKMLLLLDGFDELDESLIPSTIHCIESLIETYDDFRIIVTSRPSGEIRKSRLFKSVALLGLEKTDYKSFLTKLGVAPSKTLEIVEAIRKSPSDVSSLITTPLMMTLLVMVYESEHEIPSELPEFFEKLFVTMFSRHDKQKAGFNRKHYSGLSERRLQLLFETFCFITVRNKYGRSLSSEHFNAAFEKACQHSKATTCDVDAFRKDIVKVACLMIEEGYELTTFLHKSIAEYFAAAFVWRSANEFAQRFYATAIKNYDTWRAVLTFLEKIDPYRFAKYYSLPAHYSLVSDLELKRNSPKDFDDWIAYFVEAQPVFGVTYMQRPVLGERKHGELASDFIPSEYGPYTQNVSFGAEIHSRLVHAILDGIQEVIPTSIKEAEFVQMEGVFIREEESIPSPGYRISLNGIISQYGGDNIRQKINQFENEIWREIDQAEDLIATEEDKKEILDDDLL